MLARDSLKSIEQLASDRKKDLEVAELSIEQEHRRTEEARLERSRLVDEIARFNDEVGLTS
jgi:septal ring factor EnvC (AmiA/AmiB activator)